MKSLPLNNFFNPTTSIAFALMAVILMMIVPMPAIVLDIGLAASFSLAILIFTMTLFVNRPLDFSAFPTVLLASLILRLSLNVSSTKLIIGQGHTGVNSAGDVIAGFANFVMGGSVFLGIVVFSVLLIVNFMVITKGATRMAEVGARFSLDGMPGKQLAIDSDMSAGAITHQEAKERRELEQAETTFFGSLDGASKFVKGDAVAGLLITLLNLIAGLVMGTFVHGMPIDAAFETYAILTVGDGLVSQIPAVIISISSALLLARGGAKGSIDTAILTQFGRHPAALFSVAVLMLAFGLLPGLPFLPFSLGGICLGIMAWIAHSRGSLVDDNDMSNEVSIDENPEPSLGDLLELDDIHVEFAPNLVNMVLDPGTGLDARIANMRTHVASAFGLILPEIRLTDNAALPTGVYLLRIQGVEAAKAELQPDRVLALHSDNPIELPMGTDTVEPVYGAPARWISKNDQENAAISGVTIVTPTEVLATHLLEIVKLNFSRLFTLKSLRRLLTEMSNVTDRARAEANKKLIDELVPDKVPLDILHSVLRMLLDEQVSIRNLALILEATAEARGQNARPEAICEHVRQRLGFQLVAELRREDGSLPLVQLAPEWEDTFQTYQIEVDRGLDIALPPDVFNRLAESISEKISDINKQGVFPALITNTKRRRFLKTLMKAKGINNPVMSFEEIGTDAQPALMGVVAA
ncbi:MAG: flagellar biosynthesis protein FlhA [Paracoccaceae bacterium]